MKAPRSPNRGSRLRARKLVRLMTGQLSALVCSDTRELERLNARELVRLNASRNVGCDWASPVVETRAHVNVYRKLCLEFSYPNTPGSLSIYYLAPLRGMSFLL